MQFQPKTALCLTLTGVLILSAVPRRAAAMPGPPLQITKECSQFTGAPGSFCTITSSNVPQIKVGSKVYYTQAAGIPAGVLDSNVVLDAGNGNRAVGRCTLDLATALGICDFSDGLGSLAGFEAHAQVSLDSNTGLFHWDGTYSFDPQFDR